MKRKPNYLKHILQWGVLAAIAGTVLWANFSENPVDVEAYCPFGGLQAFGTYLVNNSLACSMSMLQIMMGLVLAVGVILFSKLFCGYLCPLGTVGEWMGRAGKKLHLQVDVPSGSVVDKLLRVVKYVLLFTILYFTLSSSELFCKKLDPFYAVATGFKGEIVLWMSLTSLTLLLLGGFVVKMFWCKYICPLGAASNIFKFTLLFVIAALGGWILGMLGVADAWIWTIGGACLAAYVVEIVKMRSCVFPLMYIERDIRTCNNCGLCEKKCPYQLPIHDYVKVKHVDCTLCGNCIGSCTKDALQVNGRRSLRWVPGLLAVVLFFIAVWMGSTMELPTIDEKWGDYEQVENLQTFEMEGLQTIKCFGSSKAFSAKMQTVPGVYGVKTFVRRHGVEGLFDPAKTDTLKIQAAIFAPTLRKYAMPGENVPMLDVVKLGVEGLHDRMDMIYFGMVLQKIEGVYGFTSEFACPVDVTVYADPAAGITEKMFEEAIDAEELVIPGQGGRKGDSDAHRAQELCGRRAGFARGVRADHVPRRGEAGGQVHCQHREVGRRRTVPEGCLRNGVPRYREDADPQCVPLFQELPFVLRGHCLRRFRAARPDARHAYSLCEVDVERREALEGDFPSREVDAPHGRRDLQGGRSAAEVHQSGQDRNRIK